jgi:hypothetical protein
MFSKKYKITYSMVDTNELRKAWEEGQRTLAVEVD